MQSRKLKLSGFIIVSGSKRHFTGGDLPKDMDPKKKAAICAKRIEVQDAGMAKAAAAGKDLWIEVPFAGGMLKGVIQWNKAHNGLRAAVGAYFEGTPEFGAAKPEAEQATTGFVPTHVEDFGDLND